MQYAIFVIGLLMVLVALFDDGMDDALFLKFGYTGSFFMLLGMGLELIRVLGLAI